MQKIKIKSTLLALLTIVTFSCSNEISTNENKNLNSTNTLNGIIGGEVVQTNDIVAGSTVSLAMLYHGQLMTFCTGTLISANLVLTASHCLANFKPTNIRINFSTKVVESIEEFMRLPAVENTMTHPLYNSGEQGSDVGLIKLAEPAPIHINRISILSEKFVLVPGINMLLAGFGIMDDINMILTKELRKVKVPLAKIEDKILVTDQNKSMGACNGDSGGPAYLEKNNRIYVYGITRGPHDNANDCHHFGEYTYASKFEADIVNMAKKLNGELPLFEDPQ